MSNVVAEVDPDAPRTQPRRAPRWAAPVAGLVAAAVAAAVASLVAAALGANQPLDAVGSEFIDHVPAWLKELAIQLFGTDDKLALRIGMFLTIAVVSLVVGAWARRRPLVGIGAFAVAGLLAAAVALGRPASAAEDAIGPLLGAAAGALVLWWIIGLVRAGDGARSTPRLGRARDGWDRRAFVTATAGAAAGAVVAGAVARSVEANRTASATAQLPDALPPVADSTLPPPPPDATLSPVTPYITPNADFYLIDTALSVPRVDVGRWRLELGGRVDRPRELSYADLLAMPQVERTITLCCVSNEVGGDLIGNAVWQGVLLAPLLEELGVRPDAQQVFATSVDGWTCGFPIEVALDGRDAMIAIGMNGEPLPRRHGFPARVVVPGLYGYVSATKWVRRIELTTWEEAVGYWVPRGWSRDAPVKTQSRIDVPRRGDRPAAGPVVVAGIAWAQHRGVQRVQVRIDDDPWQDADLGTEPTVDAWRQWRYVWQATPGEHRIQVRATDGNGDTQTDEVSRPDPDGATGWHTRRVSVS